ncbi:MAG: LemA family protein [Cetobacterium sp.]|uniref:LemA family protein n=1 Tax=Cetobacterium sp. TaxID=2071632 RepID=UPI003F3620E0
MLRYSFSLFLLLVTLTSNLFADSGYVIDNYRVDITIDEKNIYKIEEDILQARKYYNGSVRVYNTMCETFPSLIVANNFGFKKYPFFKVEEEERQNVKVQF